MNGDWASKTEPAPNLTWVKIYELIPASNLEKNTTKPVLRQDGAGHSFNPTCCHPFSPHEYINM